MSKWLSNLESVRLAFGRLNQREQFLVMGATGAVTLAILIGIGWGVSGAIRGAEHRVKVKAEQLTEVLQLQGEYRSRLAERQTRLAELDKSKKVRLVSLVEEIAREAGVEIGQLRPEESEAATEGILESRVDLRASSLSADRLQDFLERLENAPGVVVVRRLRLNRPYRRDTLDLELTVTTYKRKESGSG